ncbi:MAG: hypothetical protein V1703_03045, partial [Candidatus Altiarchaeota archaeon]
TCKLARIGYSENPVTNKNAVAAKITEFSGCPSEVFFESTACIAQDEMIRLIPSGAAPAEKKNAFGALTQRLQATLSGAQEVDIASIVSKLYAKTRNKPAKGPFYHLSSIEEQQRKLNTAKAEQETKVNDLMDKRKVLNSIKKQLEQINRDLPSKQDLLVKNKRILELQGSISRDNDQYENFERAKKLKDKLDDIDKQLKEFAYLSGRDAELKQLHDASDELQSLRKQRNDIHDKLKAAESQKPVLWKLILGVLGAVLFVGGLVAGFVANKYIYLGIGTSFGGLLVFGYWLISQIVWQRQKASLSRELGALEEQMQSKSRLVKPLLDSVGFEDFDKYQSEFNRYEDKLAERKEPYDKLSGILGDKDWGQFKSENAGLAIRVTANQEELNKLLSFKLDPLELQRLETAVNGPEGLTQQNNKLEGDKLGLDKFFAYTDADTDQLASIGETLERLEQERKFWERKQKIFETTRQVLEEANKQTLSRAADVLEKKLGNYISKITGGKYTQVRIVRAKDRDIDLSIQAFSPEKNDWVSVSELSRATQDQFYICARFALVNLITEGKKPPLLLDDPFVNFHQKRMGRTILLLQELAKENQILLFTCSDAYDHYGNVISVD